MRRAIDRLTMTQDEYRSWDILTEEAHRLLDSADNLTLVRHLEFLISFYEAEQKRCAEIIAIYKQWRKGDKNE